MGSNQGKQPHFSDKGGRASSRDERRWNRKLMRSNRDKAAKIDSAESNEIDKGLEQALQNGWLEPNTLRKRASRKWCRRKQGVEHTFEKVREFGPWMGLRMLVEFRCSVCGKTKTTWKDEE